jgi:lipopolysaccharide transport system ATP-binding protein
MGDIAIRVETLSKLYKIGGARHHHDTLRDQLADGLKSLFRRNGQPSPDENMIWALKNVSFEVKQGEVAGIIGRNGAGKSTLLKILSRITEPTAGRAEIFGRVGSLLEVGTGFHPELTGRENIYLNGAILGMSRGDIFRKFDEIVAFAEVDKFIDTPVKRYSSGMYLRLAFAVAAHLEPEILLVDEVLAVGDAAFQKKCLGKVGNVAKEGRTVLFVSHNMSSVLALCRKAYLLEAGALVSQGPSPAVIDTYIQRTISPESVPLYKRKDRSGEGSARFTFLYVNSADPSGTIRCHSPIKITLGYRSSAPLSNVSFIIGIYDYASNAEVYALLGNATSGLPEILPPEGAIECLTGPINMTPGHCHINLALVKGGLIDGGYFLDHVEYAGQFDVEIDTSSALQPLPRTWALSLVQHRWSLRGSP